MSYKQFLLSFTATALLVSPFALHADAPALVDELAVAPAFGGDAVVQGLKVSTAILKQDTRTATIQIRAKNDTKKRIHTGVVASLMQRPMTSPMARMVPMPSEIAQRKLALRLAPGETFTKTITIELPASLTAELEALERAAKENAKNAPETAQTEEEQLMLAMLQPSAPSFFASVRAPAPSKPHSKQVATLE